MAFVDDKTRDLCKTREIEVIDDLETCPAKNCLPLLGHENGAIRAVQVSDDPAFHLERLAGIS
jgi:hypothetical protein